MTTSLHRNVIRIATLPHLLDVLFSTRKSTSKTPTLTDPPHMLNNCCSSTGIPGGWEPDGILLSAWGILPCDELVGEGV